MYESLTRFLPKMNTANFGEWIIDKEGYKDLPFLIAYVVDPIRKQEGFVMKGWSNRANSWFLCD